MGTQNEPRRVPVHGSLTRRQLLAGCDRDLFLLLLMCCGLLFMSGLMKLYWPNVALSLVLWFAGLAVLARLAAYDPDFRGIVFRSLRYLRVRLPAAGRPGSNLGPVVHRRWN